MSIENAADYLAMMISAVGVIQKTNSHLQEGVSGLPLSDEILAWYNHNAPPEVDIYVFGKWMELTLYSPSMLVEHQYGCRWTGPNLQMIDPLWKPEWIAIGDWYSDPIIADTAKPGTPIYIALHGSGEWYPLCLAPSLANFLHALAIAMDFTLIKHKARIEEFEEEGNDDEGRKFVMDGLTPVLKPIIGDECVDNFYWPWKIF